MRVVAASIGKPLSNQLAVFTYTLHWNWTLALIDPSTTRILHESPRTTLNDHGQTRSLDSAAIRLLVSSRLNDQIADRYDAAGICNSCPLINVESCVRTDRIKDARVCMFETCEGPSTHLCT